MTDYLSKADLYRAACAPVELPDNFADSLRWHLTRDASDVRMPGGNVRTDEITMALRVAVRLAEEWRDLAEASQELGHEEPGSTAPEEIGRATYRAGSNHEAKYCANMLLRHLAQELYRHWVPEKERVL